jgi:hypothetical protein
LSHKVCSKCEETKSLTEFYKSKSGKNGLQAQCKECTKASSRRWLAANLDRKKETRKEWAKRNPERQREIARKAALRKYGLAVEDFHNLVRIQENKCACCEDTFTRTPHVDHNHETGEVRGLLCSNCNTMLGQAKDDPNRLEAGVAYLQTRGGYEKKTTV